MLTYHACSKCDAPVRRSRRRNLLEFLIGIVVLPYRCTICDRREMKLRFIDMEPPQLGEEEEEEEADLLIPEPTERELEEAKKAEQRAFERAAKKAAARLKKEAKAAARKKRVEEAQPPVISEVIPEVTPRITPQSHTSDEEEEQIFPS